MCGIFGYTGNKEAQNILIQGLSDLEYRGYDSAGIFMPKSGVFKAVGEVKQLKKILKKSKETIGIAHTRWATHGKPTKTNAHPHCDCNGRIWITHNGIIENYKELKAELILNNHNFRSETDSEVIAHLIEENLKKTQDLEKAVRASLNKIRGTYGILVIDKENPDRIVAARMGSPIVIGIGDDERFISSDPSTVIKYTRSIIYLDDGEIATLKRGEHKISDLNNSFINKKAEFISWNIEDIQKGGFDHFMLKEIFEIPEVIENTLMGRVVESDLSIKLGGIESVRDRLNKSNKIVIVGCGSAYYAGLIGKYLMEDLARIDTKIEYASEFRYQNPIIDKNTTVIAVSQSGETADTLAAIREAKEKGALTLGIINTVGSTIARETDAGVYNHAGPEISVASTKAFISQVSVFIMLAMFLGIERGTISREKRLEIVESLKNLPNQAREVLKQSSSIESLASKYASYPNFLFVGRKYLLPIALEGALKLKEVSYINSEGYGSGEMKHGPIALIDENFPTIALAPKSSDVYEKVLSNIEEIKARKGKIISIGESGDTLLDSMSDDFVSLPKAPEYTQTILSAILLYLLAYYAGIKKGYNVDRPRNLAKSVTVE